MHSSEVKTFIVLAIASVASCLVGSISKSEALLTIICITLIYVLLVLCRIKSEIEKLVNP